MQSIGRPMNWTFDDDMVDGLFFCATLTGRRGGHTPFSQAGAVTSDTGAEAVKPDPCSPWEGHSSRGAAVSGIKVRSLVGLSVHSAFHWWSAHCAARMLLLSEKLNNYLKEAWKKGEEQLSTLTLAMCFEQMTLTQLRQVMTRLWFDLKKF